MSNTKDQPGAGASTKDRIYNLLLDWQAGRVSPSSEGYGELAPDLTTLFDDLVALLPSPTVVLAEGDEPAHWVQNAMLEVCEYMAARQPGSEPNGVQEFFDTACQII